MNYTFHIVCRCRLSCHVCMCSWQMYLCCKTAVASCVLTVSVKMVSVKEKSTVKCLIFGGLVWFDREENELPKSSKVSFYTLNWLSVGSQSCDLWIQVFAVVLQTLKGRSTELERANVTGCHRSSESVCEISSFVDTQLYVMLLQRWSVCGWAAS